MPNVLIVEAWMPTPDTDSASLRMCEMMRLLVEVGCTVSFFPDDLNPHRGARALLEELGVRVVGPPDVSSLTEHLAADGRAYDIILLSRVYVAEKHFDNVRRLAPDAALVFDTVSLQYLGIFRWARKQRNAFLLQKALEHKRSELRMIRNADLSLVVSTYEIDVLRKDCPQADGRVLLLPTIHEVKRGDVPFRDREGIFFVGMFPHYANVDAMRFFCDDVWPLLEDRLPGAPITVVGIHPPDWLQALNSARFRVMGRVPDITPFLTGCRLSIAPIRFGSGIKGKVLLSMGYGLPVVGTSVAAEGMPLVAEEHLLCGDTPAAFADQVERLYTDEALWNRLSANGPQFVARHYSPETVRTHLRAVLDRLDS